MSACASIRAAPGRSPGKIDPFSPRETRDFYQCIEWAGVQPWSNGKVGLNGISYYGINQWQVASLEPPHLAAMCIWEGAADWYRDMTHHGGILNTFWANWFDMQVKTVQYGLGERGPVSRVTGIAICGDETLSDRELAANRADFGDEILAHPLDDEYHRARSPNWEKITVPLLSAANWGGSGVYTRAAISKASCARRRRTNGWKRTASSTGRTSIPITASSSRSASSVIFSKAKRPAGSASRACNCRSATSTASSSGTRTSGRSRARSGRSSISIPREASIASPRKARTASPSMRSAKD